MSEILQMLETGNEDILWFESNAHKLKSEFNNRFIAFHNKKVIDDDADLEQLLRKLKQQKVDTSDVFVKFVSKVKLIL